MNKWCSLLVVEIVVILSEVENVKVPASQVLHSHEKLFLWDTIHACVGMKTQSSPQNVREIVYFGAKYEWPSPRNADLGYLSSNVEVLLWNFHNS